MTGRWRSGLRAPSRNRLKSVGLADSLRRISDRGLLTARRNHRRISFRLGCFSHISNSASVHPRRNNSPLVYDSARFAAMLRVSERISVRPVFRWKSLLVEAW